MAKLYPPTVDGTLPAITKGTFTVPFSMNRSVSTSQVLAIRLKIKTIQNDMFLETIDATSYAHINGTNYEAYFTIPTGSSFAPVEGMSYKFQLAYVDKSNVVGYYSTVGVAKYTTEPTVKVEDMKPYLPNNVYSQFIGTYSQENGDTTEKEYNYRFQVFDSNGATLDDTGYLLHNSSNDTVAYESHDTYTFGNLLEPNTIYYLQYSINSVNGLARQTPKYKIIDTDTVMPDVQGNLAAQNCFDNGYILLTFQNAPDEKGAVRASTGNFELYRSNGNTYELIHRFQLNGNLPSEWSFKDMTVEHGQTYQYFVKQYNSVTGVYSSRLNLSRVLNESTQQYEAATKITATFEDAFLYDGERQLRIRFNPKVSSFKTDVLETKQDTLGGRTPHFYRNGNVYYKEFPISGLISYLSDNEDLFLTRADLGIEVDNTIRETTNAGYQGVNRAGVSLEDYNIRAERLFKLEVLDWLNNGKPKLFRSPGEGNYLVRLMSSSMTPTDTVGRMLHTFSSTAYEVDSITYDNLFKYGIYKEVNWKNEDINKTEETLMQYGSVNLTVTEKATDSLRAIALAATEDEMGSVTKLRFDTELIPTNEGPWSLLHIEDAVPGSVFLLNGEETVIGSTGTYHLELIDGIFSFQVPSGQKVESDPYSSNDGFNMNDFRNKSAALSNGLLQSSITYGFKPHTSTLENGGDFGKYNKVELDIVPDQLVLGAQLNILRDDSLVIDDANPGPINTCTFNLNHISNIKLTKRDIQVIYYDDINSKLNIGTLTAGVMLDIFGEGGTTAPISCYLDKKLTERITDKYSLVWTNLFELHAASSDKKVGYLTFGGYQVKFNGDFRLHFYPEGAVDEHLLYSAIFGNVEYDIDLADRWQQVYHDISAQDVNQLWLGLGVMADITYYATDVTYSFESTSWKSDVESAEAEFSNWLKNLTVIDNSIVKQEQTYLKEIRQLKMYRAYQAAVALKDYNRTHGIE